MKQEENTKMEKTLGEQYLEMEKNGTLSESDRVFREKMRHGPLKRLTKKKEREMTVLHDKKVDIEEIAKQLEVPLAQALFFVTRTYLMDSWAKNETPPKLLMSCNVCYDVSKVTQKRLEMNSCECGSKDVTLLTWDKGRYVKMKQI